MARRGRKRGSGIDATIIAALVLVGGIVWVIKALWPLLLVVGAGALVVYIARRFGKSAPGRTEMRPDVVLESRLKARRSERGQVVRKLSAGRATSSSAEAEGDADPDTAWVRPGQAVTVGPYTIPGGMLYLGERLPAVSRWGGVEPALINPRLPIDAAQPDRDGTRMSYWPSYSDIPPPSRAAYLEWLASGRTRSDVGIGYVFLFFYGLERRLLADAKHSSAARAEGEQLQAEVERLIGLYGTNSSFRGYAGSLLNAMRVQHANGRVYNSPPPLERSGYELPYTVRVALAQLAADKRPIPAEWAWSWLVCTPDAPLRTPARRCPEEFRALFLARYVRKFGPGIVVNSGKTKLSLTYRPASASFGGTVDISVGHLADVASLSEVSQALRELADACGEDLAPYSRWIGRNSDARGSVTAAAMLPAELLDSAASAAIRPLREWLEGRLVSDARVVVPTGDLLRFWPEVSGAKMAKPDAVAFAQLLATLGYALEPDVRFGGPPLATDQPTVVFRLPGESPTAPSPPYNAATLMLHVGAAVADADGTVTAEEERHLEGQLESALHLSSAERVRLRAHLTWLLAAEPGTAGLKKRIATLDQAQRRAVGRYLVAVAGADGRFDPTEVTALTKMYRLLGFTANEAYSDVHALASTTTPPAAEPVTVQRAETTDTGFSIPPPLDIVKGAPRDVLELDMARVHATLAETKAVAALLTDIFVDDEGAAVPVPPPQASDHPVHGLDARHSAFVRTLAERDTWPQAELEVLAAKHQLLPEGALDSINEAALDRCGELLCEGDDPVTVNANVAKELLG